MIVSTLIVAVAVFVFTWLVVAYPAIGTEKNVLLNITVHSLELPSHVLQKRHESKPWDPPYKGKPPAWPSQGDATFPIPGFERTCTTDARVALWKWRYLCDRANDESLKTTNPRTRIRFCFHHPPSAELCCDADGNAKYGQTCVSSPLWPQDEQEAAWCGNCRLSLGPCIFGNYAEINNPENVCKCQFEKCYIPDEFNWMAINPATDSSGYPGLKVETYQHEVKTWYGLGSHLSPGDHVTNTDLEAGSWL